jgi:hypothetical protein
MSAKDLSIRSCCAGGATGGSVHDSEDVSETLRARKETSNVDVDA